MNQMSENRMLHNLRELWNVLKPPQIAVIVLAVLAVLASAVSGVFFPSSFSPLFILVGLAALGFLILTIRRPIYAFYMALFISILPTGLLTDSQHSFFNRNLTFFALAVWGLDLLIHRRPLVWTITNSIMLAFLVWSAASIIWAPYLEFATDIFQTYVQRFLLFLVILVNLMKDRKALSGVMRLLGLLGIVIIGLSIQALIQRGYFPGTRFALGNINENDYGITLIITMMGVLWEGMRPENAHRPLIKILSGVYVLFVIALTMLSGSRGSAISLMLILGFFAYLNNVRVWAIFIVVMVVITYLIVPEIFQTTVSRFLSEDGGSLLGGREPIWRAGIKLIAANLWTGVGIGNAPYVIREIVSGSHSPGMDRVSLHNPILAIFGETGLLGIILYLGTILSAILVMLKHLREDMRFNRRYFMNYYPLIAAVFIGYMASWIKGGGMERDSSLYLLIALLLVPSLIKNHDLEEVEEAAETAG